MRSYIERAQDFVREIFPYIDHEFNGIFNERCSVKLFNYDHKRKVELAHGLSRIALITSDYVVKYDYDQHYVERFGGGEAECELYQQAEADGFGYLFAKITRYEYKGRSFYIMPRIKKVGSADWDAWDYMTEEESEWCYDHGVFDLHENNFGFRNGHVCLIDYGAHD